MPGAAARIRRRYGAAVVLKGARSVLCAEEGMALNSFGTPAMAKGGSGDALTGVMAALLAGRAAGAYAMDDLFLMQAACALHGLAGERAARRYGERGALATDLCACLGFDFLEEGAREDTRPCAASSPLGRTVHVTVEHRRDTRDAQGRVYELPCGYVSECLEGENRWAGRLPAGGERLAGVVRGRGGGSGHAGRRRRVGGRAKRNAPGPGGGQARDGVFGPGGGR